MTGKLNQPNFDRALAEAKQGIMMLQAQAEVGRIDPKYLKRRMAKFAILLDELSGVLKAGESQTRLAALYEASRLIGSTLDLQAVLEQVMDSVVELSGAERGFVMLLNDDGKLEFQVARNLDKEALSSGDFAVSRTISRQVIDRDASILTTNAAEDPRFSQQKSIMIHNLRSIMAAPLRARGRPIGVVYVDNRVHQGTFNKADLDLLEAFAQQAAIAILNARLFTTTDAELNERLEELSQLRLIDRRLSATLDLDRAIDITLEWAARITGASYATLCLRDSAEADDVFRVVAHHSPNSTPTQALGAHIWNAAHPLIKRVLETGELVHLSLKNAPALDDYWYLAVPVYRERTAIGIIALEKDTPFDADAGDFVTRLADRAAVAIENARLYEAVIAAKQATDEFVSVASHELKTPMVSIRGYADMMVQGMAGEVTEQQKRFLSIIARNVLRLEAIVSDLTDVSRIDTGHIHVEIGEVEVREIIEQARDSSLGQIEERSHTLHIDLPPDLPNIRADPQRLMQIMNNLLSNAYKYTPNGGTITISCRRTPDGDHVEIAVSDTGIGMTAQELEKLGKKFWRADNEHVTAQRGTGLGFAITKSLIELMDGELSIESTPGKGSTFAFTLPVA